MCTFTGHTITPEIFLKAAKDFLYISNKINDGWSFIENTVDLHKSYLKKETYIKCVADENVLLKAEYVVFYHLSYGVPSFSFNIWNSSGVLLTLEDIRQMSFVMINKSDFYSVVTQQEHPLFQRPYFIVHPCHTEALLLEFKSRSKNIIVTFLGLVSPLIDLKLPMEYGLNKS